MYHVPLTPIAEEVKLLVQSRYGLIVFKTFDQPRAHQLAKSVAQDLNIPLMQWRLGKGFEAKTLPTTTGRGGSAALNIPALQSLSEIKGSSTLAQSFLEIEQAFSPMLAMYAEIGKSMDDLSEANLYEAVKKLEAIGGAVLICDDTFEIPQVLRPHAMVLRIPPPRLEEYQELIGRVFNKLEKTSAVRFEITTEENERLSRSLQGLSLTEAEKIITKGILRDQKLSISDLEIVQQAKKQILEREGILEFFPSETPMHQVAGMENLKAWLEQRKKLLINPSLADQMGLTFPKGILLVGVPGSGKSLMAKAVAHTWQLPLIKLDLGSLYNQYIGETERNLRRAFDSIEAVAPVVLWLDEIEKALSAGRSSEDGGLSSRIFGTVLSWMQERKGQVFLVATANDVSKLPPELLRKGRFDEIFFADLPDLSAREDIFKIHLRARKHSSSSFDLRDLAIRSDGFSGAEIEQAIISAIFIAFSNETPLSDQEVKRQLDQTVPLSVTRAEDIAQIRSWGQTRAVKV